MTVHADCTVEIVTDAETIALARSPAGKPFLRLVFTLPGGKTETACLTMNLAEMVGGAARGARMNYEDGLRRAT